MGFVRRIDDLHRIVLPIEMVRALGLASRAPINFTLEGNRIVLEKAETEEYACTACGGIAPELVGVGTAKICHSCIKVLTKAKVVYENE